MCKFNPDCNRENEAGNLAAQLRQRFDVVEHPLEIAGLQFQMLHPRSADDLIDDAAFNRDERLPYWAEVWPSAYVLAQRIAAEGGKPRPSRRRLLELGCGSGLVVLAALAVGCDVTAIDYYPEALEFVRLNAMLNRLPPPETRVVDWREYPAELVGFDLVVAADVLYERDYSRLVAAALRQSLRPGGLALLADPQRTKAETFPDECRRAGLHVSDPQVFGPLTVPGADHGMQQTVNLFEIRRAA